ncbi:hypothetical protein D3C72_1316020 [compost metagenome]
MVLVGHGDQQAVVAFACQVGNAAHHVAFGTDRRQGCISRTEGVDDLLQDDFGACVCRVALVARSLQRGGCLANTVFVREESEHMAGGVESAAHVGHGGIKNEGFHGRLPRCFRSFRLKLLPGERGVGQRAMCASAPRRAYGCKKNMDENGL